MVRRTKIMMWSVFLTICISCEDRIQEATRNETTLPFTGIRLKSVFSVSLVQDTAYSITITSDETVLNDVEVRVEDGVLILSNEGTGRWLNPQNNHIVVVIRAPTFSHLSAEQSYSLTTPYPLRVYELIIVNDEKVKVSDITLDLECHFFFYWNNWLSGGRLSISGHARYAEMHNYALHVIQSENLEVENLLFYNNGREDCEIRATDKLEYTLNGPGNILLHGRPSELTLLEKTSTGKLIMVD